MTRINWEWHSLIFQQNNFCHQYDQKQCNPSIVLCILDENSNKGCGEIQVCPETNGKPTYGAPIENPNMEPEWWTALTFMGWFYFVWSIQLKNNISAYTTPTHFVFSAMNFIVWNIAPVFFTVTKIKCVGETMVL